MGRPSCRPCLVSGSLGAMPIRFYRVTELLFASKISFGLWKETLPASVYLRTDLNLTGNAQTTDVGSTEPEF